MEVTSLDNNVGDENAGDGGKENESWRRRDANNVWMEQHLATSQLLVMLQEAKKEVWTMTKQS
eukprot:10906897-Ditylum_brightwellii.AAC.1